MTQPRRTGWVGWGQPERAWSVKHQSPITAAENSLSVGPLGGSVAQPERRLPRRDRTVDMPRLSGAAMWQLHEQPDNPLINKQEP